MEDVVIKMAQHVCCIVFHTFLHDLGSPLRLVTFVQHCCRNKYMHRGGGAGVNNITNVPLRKVLKLVNGYVKRKMKTYVF